MARLSFACKRCLVFCAVLLALCPAPTSAVKKRSPFEADLEIDELSRFLRRAEVARREEALLRKATESKLSAARTYISKLERELAKVSDEAVLSRLHFEFSSKDLQQNVEDMREEVEEHRATAERVRADAENPSLGKWLGKRAEEVGVLVGDENVGKPVGEAVEEAYDGAIRFEETLENAFQSGTGTPKRLSALLSVIVLFVPLYVLWKMVARLTTSLTFWQHLLIGHVFNAVVAFTALTMLAFLGVDPFLFTWTAPVARVVVSLFFVAQWTVMSLLISKGALSGSASLSNIGGKSRLEGLSNARTIFASQLFLFVGLIWHVRSQALENLSLAAREGGSVRSNVANYVLYGFGAAALAAMTVWQSKGCNQTPGIVGDAWVVIEKVRRLSSARCPRKVESENELPQLSRQPDADKGL